jgi:hypothetical protein
MSVCMLDKREGARALEATAALIRSSPISTRDVPGWRRGRSGAIRGRPEQLRRELGDASICHQGQFALHSRRSVGDEGLIGGLELTLAEGSAAGALRVSLPRGAVSQRHGDFETTGIHRLPLRAVCPGFESPTGGVNLENEVGRWTRWGPVIGRAGSGFPDGGDVQVVSFVEYVAWVQRCSDKTADDATTATVDFALREVFRRDRLWRDERRIPERTPAAKPSTTPASTLPPPGGTPRDPRPS